jgi:holin-like protein
MPLLDSLLVFLACQLAGEVGARLLGLPLPGPVIGLALLFAGLAVRRRVPKALDTGADALLTHLSLLFVPAGVGVVLHLGLVAREWLPLLVAIVFGTIVAIAATALLMAALLKRFGDAAPADEPDPAPGGGAAP